MGGVRRRILLLCAALLVAGFVVRPAAETLLSVWWDVTPGWCGAPGPESSNIICRQLFRRPSIPMILATAFVLMALLAACYPAIRWCLRPLHDLTPVIANVGPQNLGHRLRPGDGRDELAVLGRTIDDMMDRIAVGYEAQRRFAANASHELRTPLAVQRTLIEVGLARKLKEGQLELLAAQLLETNERNERLIEGLLALSESDRGLISRTPLRLDRITAEVLDAHRARAEAAGVTITSELAPRVVIGEQVLLERLVSNLVQNAVRYNRPDGTIDVQVGDDPALIVTNTGDDVPAEAVSALFEPFRRLSNRDRLVDSSATSLSRGAGLGLSIVQAVAHAHGGRATARTRDGGGLAIRVEIPLRLA